MGGFRATAKCMKNQAGVRGQESYLRWWVSLSSNKSASQVPTLHWLNTDLGSALMKLMDREEQGGTGRQALDHNRLCRSGRELTLREPHTPSR